MRSSGIRTGVVTVAAAGTPQPLTQVYATGTITTVVGSNRITGSGTTFSDANTPPGSKLQTAGVKTYTVRKFLSTTELEIEEKATAAEAGVGYVVWEPIQCESVLLKSANANSGAVGYYAETKAKAVAATGGELVKANNLAERVKVDLSKTMLWVDVSTNGDKIKWTAEIS